MIRLCSCKCTHRPTTQQSRTIVGCRMPPTFPALPGVPPGCFSRAVEDSNGAVRSGASISCTITTQLHFPVVPQLFLDMKSSFRVGKAWSLFLFFSQTYFAAHISRMNCPRFFWPLLCIFHDLATLKVYFSIRLISGPRKVGTLLFMRFSSVHSYG